MRSALPVPPRARISSPPRQPSVPRDVLSPWLLSAPAPGVSLRREPPHAVPRLPDSLQREPKQRADVGPERDALPELQPQLLHADAPLVRSLPPLVAVLHPGRLPRRQLSRPGQLLQILAAIETGHLLPDHCEQRAENHAEAIFRLVDDSLVVHRSEFHLSQGLPLSPRKLHGHLLKAIQVLLCQ